jgi:hypothetical protein
MKSMYTVSMIKRDEHLRWRPRETVVVKADNWRDAACKHPECPIWMMEMTLDQLKKYATFVETGMYSSYSILNWVILNHMIKPTTIHQFHLQ